jgi:hypothetical protein
MLRVFQPCKECTDPPADESLWQLLNMHAQGGSLLPGELAGGKSGKNLRYTLPSVRGDLIRYVSGREEECHNIGLCSEIADQMVLKLKDLVPLLARRMRGDEGASPPRGSVPPTRERPPHEGASHPRGNVPPTCEENRCRASQRRARCGRAAGG